MTALMNQAAPRQLESPAIGANPKTQHEAIPSFRSSSATEAQEQSRDLGPTVPADWTYRGIAVEPAVVRADAQLAQEARSRSQTTMTCRGLDVDGAVLRQQADEARGAQARSTAPIRYRGLPVERRSSTITT